MSFRKYFILDFKSYLANGMILGFFTGLIDAVIDVAHYINIGASIGTVIMPVIYLPSDAINFVLICMVTWPLYEKFKVPPVYDEFDDVDGQL